MIKIMKLTTLNLLRGGVFSLAVVAAFAFTQPMPQYTMVWGEDPIIGAVQVNLEDENVTYECDLEDPKDCLYEDEGLTTPIDQSPQGQFHYTGPAIR